MSSFDGLPAREKTEGGSYEPGLRGYNQSVVDELVSAYLKTDTSTWEHAQIPIHIIPFSGDLCHSVISARHECATLLSLIKELPEHLRDTTDSQGLLDAIVLTVDTRADRSHAKRSHLLLSPVLNALYGTGHNNLVLDLRHVHYSPARAPISLQGDETEALSLTCLLPSDTGHCAERASHVNMHISGRTLRVGQQSQNSDFTLEDYTSWAGHMAEASTFRFLGVEVASIVPNPSDLRPFYDIDITSHLLYLSKGSSVHEVRLDEEFFDQGNRILIPNGKDGWKEVLP